MNIQTEDGTNTELTTAALQQLSTKELIAVNNALSDTHLESWKASKAKLMNKILKEAGVDGSRPSPEAAAEARADAAKTAKAVGGKKSKKAKKQKEPKTPREPSKGLQVLMGIVAASSEGKYASLESLTEYASTSAGSVRSYVTYYRNGQKGFPQIPITLSRGEGFILDKADIPTAETHIQNWK